LPSHLLYDDDDDDDDNNNNNSNNNRVNMLRSVLQPFPLSVTSVKMLHKNFSN